MNKKNCRRGLSLLLALVMIVSFMFPIITPSAVENSGETSNGEYICGLEEHTHTKLNGCYEDDIKYLCGDENHEHIESCIKHNYTLICDKLEHTHTDGCLANDIMATSIEEEVTGEEIVGGEEEVGGDEEIGEEEDSVVEEEEQTVYTDGDLIPLLVNVYLPPDQLNLPYTYTHYNWAPQSGYMPTNLEAYDGHISTDTSVESNLIYGDFYQGRLDGLSYSCNSGDVNQNLGKLKNIG